jgi:hypothetical protein
MRFNLEGTIDLFGGEMKHVDVLLLGPGTKTTPFCRVSLPLVTLSAPSLFKRTRLSTATNNLHHKIKRPCRGAKQQTPGSSEDPLGNPSSRFFKSLHLRVVYYGGLSCVVNTRPDPSIPTLSLQSSSAHAGLHLAPFSKLAILKSGVYNAHLSMRLRTRC